MDLTRAKTALIVAFLILNIYLGYQLWHKSEIFLSYLTVTMEEADEVLGQLRDNNYQMAASLPRQIQTMSFLSVQAQELEEEEFLQALFPPESTPTHQVTEGEARYTLNGEILIFPGKGRAVYEKPLLQAVPLEGRDLQKQGEEFLKSRGLLPDDARFSMVIPGEGNKSTVSFYQVYQGIPLYTSHINVHFLGGDLSGFDIYWLEPLEFSGEKRYVLPATQALLRFLEVQGPAREPEEIVSMTLGYFSRDYDAQRWDVVPVWRIASSRGRVVYINAFSGEEEEN